MQYRELGRTGFNVSTVSFGAWAIGADWGAVDDSESLRTLHRAVDLGINFFDTADVYGNGRSEKLLARLKRERPDANIIIATKAGRRLDPHVAEAYTPANLTAFIERSLRYLESDALDLVQLHCPPTAVYYTPELFDALDRLKQQGKIKHYGVSVEKVEEALKAIAYPGVETVQIIFNMFRQRPAELFFREAQRLNVGILARVPLSSGMLTGKMTRTTTFSANDHRQYNRHGQAFDVGETFSGVDYETGLDAVDRLKALKPAGMTMAQFALRWILMFEAVTCTIPGAKNIQQINDNAAAADLPPLDQTVMAGITAVYDELVRPQVHQRW